MTYKERTNQIVEIAFERLCGKVTGKRIEVANEASLQLQFASILKTLGELYEETKNERFNIELEKNVTLLDSDSVESRKRVDIWFSLEDKKGDEQRACAIELKFFKRANQREPNNRYDVFQALHDLERYGKFADTGYLLVATDHPHYINQKKYSEDTRDFDFRDGSKYQEGTELVYRTQDPYGSPIRLRNNYCFNWNLVESDLKFLFVRVVPYG